MLEYEILSENYFFEKKMKQRNEKILGILYIAFQHHSEEGVTKNYNVGISSYIIRYSSKHLVSFFFFSYFNINLPSDFFFFSNMYTHTRIHTHTHIYIYIYLERERGEEGMVDFVCICVSVWECVLSQQIYIQVYILVYMCVGILNSCFCEHAPKFPNVVVEFWSEIFTLLSSITVFNIHLWIKCIDKEIDYVDK